MAVRIDSVSVNGLGPISSLQWALQDINLIYGKNEKGKTFLVEYLLSSLFSNAPKGRNLTDSGQVIVSGIGTSRINFNPKTKKKIEDYILSPTISLINLARLCVIKGGESSMTSKAGETVTKAVLKDYLSDQAMLDTILGRVPVVVKESIFEDGIILPKRQMGIIKDWKALQEEINSIKELLELINDEYSLGQARKAQIELDEINRLISQQLMAKRFLAFKLSLELSKVQSELDSLPEEIIDRVKGLIWEIGKKKEQIEDNNKRSAELQPRLEHYHWLETAVDACKARPEGLKREEGKFLIVLSLVLIAVTIIAAFFEPYISLSAGLLAVGAVFFMVKQFRTNLLSKNEREEVQEIYREFAGKFGGEIISIATLEEKLKSLQPVYYELEQLRNGMELLEKDLVDLERKLHKEIYLLSYKGDEDPEVFISIIEKKRKTASLEKNEIEKRLASLNISPEDYLNNPSDSVFEFEVISQLEESRDKLLVLLKNEEAKLDGLKNRARTITRDAISVSWDELLDHLLKIHESKVEDCKSKFAEILGGIIITGVISDLRKMEDEHIIKALESDIIVEPIKIISPNYIGVELEGDELVAFNEMQRYNVSTLSTGAQEQVLLALRIGIAEHILGDQKLFLILDDAFQHSDWDRRERLVDAVGELAAEGWQIIYFTMDDHIKKLFEERIKPKFDKRYCLVELSN